MSIKPSPMKRVGLLSQCQFSSPFESPGAGSLFHLPIKKGDPFMNITQLIFLRPRRENPQSYKDEGHSLEISPIPLQRGDIRRWDDEMWQVAHIETYSASTTTNNGFQVAMLTPDGTIARPIPLRIGDQRLMYLCISSEDFALAWPDPAECLPEIGCEAPPFEGWQVDRMQEFVGDRPEALYDRVLVCWCVPISAASDATAA
jgi:hypothetical protein